MSKRSGLSRFQDIKRGFVDIGRYRYMFRRFDMEQWRNTPCPQCGIYFTEEPRYSYNGTYLHWNCADAYIEAMQQEYDEDLEEYS